METSAKHGQTALLLKKEVLTVDFKEQTSSIKPSYNE